MTLAQLFALMGATARPAAAGDEVGTVDDLLEMQEMATRSGFHA